MKAVSNTRGDLSTSAQKLLELIVRHTKTKAFIIGRPETYLGYKECCEHLGVMPPEGDVPWGRLLQQNGLNDLNEWTIRHNFPRVTGLIVNQSGDLKYLPGGDYFKSNGRNETDFDWWEDQIKSVAVFDWKRALKSVKL